jgi:hypothetical protein
LLEIFVEIAFGSAGGGVVSVVVGVVAVDVDVDAADVVFDFFDEAIVLSDFGARVAFDVEPPLFGACVALFGACAFTFGAFVVVFGPAAVASDALATDSAATVAIARNVFMWIPPGVVFTRNMPAQLTGTNLYFQ